MLLKSLKSFYVKTEDSDTYKSFICQIRLALLHKGSSVKSVQKMCLELNFFRLNVN